MSGGSMSEGNMSRGNVRIPTLAASLSAHVAWQTIKDLVIFPVEP